VKSSSESRTNLNDDGAERLALDTVSPSEESIESPAIPETSQERSNNGDIPTDPYVVRELEREFCHAQLT
jgi:hypothetical protein